MAPRASSAHPPPRIAKVVRAPGMLLSGLGLLSVVVSSPSLTRLRFHLFVVSSGFKSGAGAWEGGCRTLTPCVLVLFGPVTVAVVSRQSGRLFGG